MKTILLSMLLLLLALPLQAAEPARVLLFGTFHFQDAGLDVVKQQDVDVLTAEWQAEAMFDYAKAHDSPEMNTFNAIIQSFTEEDAQARATQPLAELLRRANGAEQERRKMDLYLATNAIGAGDGYAGEAVESYF